MSSQSDILSLSDIEYAKFIAEFVDQMDPATRAHLAVAYQNFIPYISALHRHYDKLGIPFTIENVIAEWEAESNPELDEIAVRRHSWFFFAALLARLEKLARRTEVVRPIAAAIWTVIITEYPRLKLLLPHNVVWSDEEKEWFQLQDSDERLMEVAINHHIPPQFSREEIVKRFASDLGLFYWPEKSRIGFVP